MLTKHFNKKNRNEYGLSMIELLVVIVIIGILAATAIGVTLNQRVRANDATLKSDLRNVASQIAAWNVDNTNFQDALDTHNIQYNIMGDKSVNHGRDWNDNPELPTVSVSDYARVEVVIINGRDDLTNWERQFEPGEFCLVANHPNSTFNYTPGAGNPALYDKNLFYDVKAGGVKTMDELIGIYENNQEISCYGYVTQFIKSNTNEKA